MYEFQVNSKVSKETPVPEWHGGFSLVVFEFFLSPNMKVDCNSFMVVQCYCNSSIASYQPARATVCKMHTCFIMFLSAQEVRQGLHSYPSATALCCSLVRARLFWRHQWLCVCTRLPVCVEIIVNSVISVSHKQNHKWVHVAVCAHHSVFVTDDGSMCM